jgi:hypothetical protein
MRDSRLRRLRPWIQLAALLAFPILGRSQAPQPSSSLVIAGSSEHAPLVTINGKSYIDIESLARITHASISFQTNQIVLSLPGSSTDRPQPQARQDTTAKQGFSEEFVKAGIEEMTVIREWRIAIVNAVQTNNPVTDDWVSGFRRSADSKLTLASAVARTPSDHKGVELLKNEFNNMRQLSDHFLSLHKSASYISPDSFDNNPLDQKILTCARSLAAMAAANEYQDDTACQ